MYRLKDSDCPSPQTDKLPSNLHPSKFKLTSIDSFWKSVETTAATGKPLPATANYSNSMQQSEPHLQDLSNTIIILPRITTMIRPVMKQYRRNAANHVWQDTAAWSKDLLLEMLTKFLSITGARTIPGLAEYKILPDKASSACTCLLLLACMKVLLLLHAFVVQCLIALITGMPGGLSSCQAVDCQYIRQTGADMALKQHDKGDRAIATLQGCISRGTATNTHAVAAVTHFQRHGKFWQHRSVAGVGGASRHVSILP